MGLFADMGHWIARQYHHKRRRAYEAGKQAVADGVGSIFSAGALLRGRKGKKPLVVLGCSAEEEKLFRSLRDNDLSWVTYSGLSVPPTAADAEAICRVWWEEGCDSFIALGDGPVLDVTKAAAACVAGRGRSVKDMAGFGKLPRRRPPVVLAVPTVAGTGAESLARAFLRDEGGSRLCLAGKTLTPDIVVLDPMLLEHTPRVEVAEAGMDGLCRAVEAWLSPGKGDDVARTMAADAVKGFLENLEPCWNNGGTVRQRSGLLEASRLAGAAASTLGYGYARVMARSAAEVAGLEFGSACAVILPDILEKYGSDAREKLARLSEISGVMTGGGQIQRAAAFIERLRAMCFRMGLSDTLVGMTREVAEQIAYMSAQDDRCFAPVFWPEARCRAVFNTFYSEEDTYNFTATGE